MLKFIFISLMCFVGASSASAKVEARFGMMLDLHVTELMDRPTKRVSVPVSMLVKPPAGIECSYYNSYMIKQIFVGGTAAESTVLIPIENATKSKCGDSQFIRQMQLPQKLGLLLGVKGDYAFFQGDEPRNPSFVVLRLKDQVIVFVGRAQQDMTNHGILIRKIELRKNELVLEYMQSSPVDCSVLVAGKKCVAQIAKHMKVKKELVAQKCKMGYQAHLQTLAKNWCRENNPKDPTCLANQSQKMQFEQNRSPSEIHELIEARIPANAKSLKPAKNWDSLLKLEHKYISHIDQDFECAPQT